MKAISTLLFFVSSYFLIAQDNKQNFVLILVDDLGWKDVGFMGSDFYETPNIDSPSRESIIFDNAYSSSSVCSPSRAAILTGKHPARLHITDWIPGLAPKDKKLLGAKNLDELPLEELTIAELLKSNGYSTFFAGKWHLGNEGYFPENQGFDVNIGGNHTGQPKGGYYAPYDNPQLQEADSGEYLTDRLTTESIQFVQSVSEKPFFLFLPYYTVHTPIQPCGRHFEKFNSKLKQLDDETVYRFENDSKTTLNQRNPGYASMVYALDENIGRLITALKEMGEYENTTIIFTSDNGGLTTLLVSKTYEAPTSVFPLRAGKGWLYEGGIRVPLLIKPANYTDHIMTISEPVIGHDFFPTIMSLANVKKPENLTLDGYDISVLFEGKSDLDREEIYWHYPHYHGSGWRPGAAIRQGDWKLIEFYESQKVELYNLSVDISEAHDVSLSNPDKVKSLRSKLHLLQKSMNASMAKNNKAFKKTR